MRSEAAIHSPFPMREPVISREELLRLSPYYIPLRLRSWLLTALAFASFVLIVVIFAQPVAVGSKFGALLVCIPALIPIWLWITGKAPGLPFFPLLAGEYIFSFGVPLISSSASFQQYTTVDNMTINYTPQEHVFAGGTACLYLTVATAVWLLVLQQPISPPRYFRQLETVLADVLFIGIIMLAIVYSMAMLGQWFVISSGIFPLVRIASMGLSSLAILILFYRAGRRELPRSSLFISMVLVVFLSLVSNLTLYIGYGVGVLVFAVAAYTVGRRKVPIFASLAVLAIAVVLHHGKGEMRYDYWQKAILEERPIEAFQPKDYLPLYVKWVRYGLDDLRYTTQLERENNLANWRLLDRMAIVQMLLLVHARTSFGLPFLYGETYSSIPYALLPRIFFPNKPQPHQGAFVMNLHFGTLTKERLQSTYIEWGFLAEAYANFGMIGVICLGIITGLLLAYLTRLCLFTGVLALRTMIASFISLLILDCSSSTGLFVVSAFQGMIVLLIFGFLFMTRSGELSPGSP